MAIILRITCSLLIEQRSWGLVTNSSNLGSPCCPACRAIWALKISCTSGGNILNFLGMSVGIRTPVSWMATRNNDQTILHPQFLFAKTHIHLDTNADRNYRFSSSYNRSRTESIINIIPSTITITVTNEGLYMNTLCIPSTMKQPPPIHNLSAVLACMLLIPFQGIFYLESSIGI